MKHRQLLNDLAKLSVSKIYAIKAATMRAAVDAIMELEGDNEYLKDRLAKQHTHIALLKAHIKMLEDKDDS
jgi:hypothetical protein